MPLPLAIVQMQQEEAPGRLGREEEGELEIAGHGVDRDQSRGPEAPAGDERREVLGQEAALSPKGVSGAL